MLKEIQEVPDLDIGKIRRAHYEEQILSLRPISLSMISLGQTDRVPCVMRHDSISILKENTNFTSYSQYINKNVIDIQLAYEKNADKCRLSLVRKLLKNKGKREKTLSFISLFKAVYSDLIVRMEKKFEEGSSFPSVLYDSPSEVIKFDLLKVLRTQLAVHGTSTFKDCLQLLQSFDKGVMRDFEKSHNASKSTHAITELTAFFTEMISSTIKEEIRGFYELIRDTLWFANWLVENNLHTSEKEATGHLEFAIEDQNQPLLDRAELRSYDSLCRSLYCLKLATTSLLQHQSNLSESLKSCVFTARDLSPTLGLNSILPCFLLTYYPHLLSTHLENLSYMSEITQTALRNFLSLALFNTKNLQPTTIPIILQMLVSFKEYSILDRCIGVLKERTPAIWFIFAMCKANKGSTEEFIDAFCTGVTQIRGVSNEDDRIIQAHIFGKEEYDREFMVLARHSNNPSLVFAKS